MCAWVVCVHSLKKHLSLTPTPMCRTPESAARAGRGRPPGIKIKLVLMKMVLGELRRGFAGWKSEQAAFAQDKQFGLPTGRCSQSMESTIQKEEEAEMETQKQLREVEAAREAAQERQGGGRIEWSSCGDKSSHSM